LGGIWSALNRFFSLERPNAGGGGHLEMIKQKPRLFHGHNNKNVMPDILSKKYKKIKFLYAIQKTNMGSFTNAHEDNSVKADV